eukprot:357902-Chlamydomonas_euryale.AAC.2
MKKGIHTSGESRAGRARAAALCTAAPVAVQHSIAWGMCRACDMVVERSTRLGAGTNPSLPSCIASGMGTTQLGLLPGSFDAQHGRSEATATGSGSCMTASHRHGGQFSHHRLRTHRDGNIACGLV